MMDKLGTIKVDYPDVTENSSFPFQRTIAWLIGEVERQREKNARQMEYVKQAQDIALSSHDSRVHLCHVLAELTTVATGYEPSEDRYQAAVKAASLALRKYWQTGGAEAETENPYYGDNFEENVRARLRREGWLDHEPTEEEWRAAGSFFDTGSDKP